MVAKKQGSGSSEKSAPPKTPKQSTSRKDSSKPDDDSAAPKTAKRGSGTKGQSKSAAKPAAPKTAKRTPRSKDGSKPVAEPAPSKTVKPSIVNEDHSAAANEPTATKTPKHSSKSAEDSPAPKPHKRSSSGEGRFRSVEELLTKVAHDQGLDRDDVDLSPDNMIVVEGQVTSWKATVSYTATGMVWFIRQQAAPETSRSASSGSSALRPTRRNPYNGAVFPSTDDMLAHIAYHQEVDEDEVSLADDNRIAVKRQLTNWKAVATETTETTEGTLWMVREVVE